VLDFMWTRLTEADLSALASSLSALPSLSDLALDLVGDRVLMSAPVLAMRCPALRRLSLAHVRVPSLDFLRHSPLLEHLHFRMCFRMNAHDVVESLRDHAPPRLRTLAVHLCSGLRFNDEQRAALSPPSALLPCLVEFDYRDRVADLRRIFSNGSIQRAAAATHWMKEYPSNTLNHKRSHARGARARAPGARPPASGATEPAQHAAARQGREWSVQRSTATLHSPRCSACSLPPGGLHGSFIASRSSLIVQSLFSAIFVVHAYPVPLLAS
jgi:hypothetical protein